MSNQIIQIRGTHGAGKSYLVRAVMAQYEIRAEVKAGKTILGYRCTSETMKRLYVPGKYPGDVGGGCDAIGSMDEIFEPIEIMAGVMSILFEGILAQHSMPRMRKLREDTTENIDIVVLSTSIEECIESVEARRLAKGNLKPLNPKNLMREYKSVHSIAGKLESEGFRIHRLDREAALQFVLEQLRTVGDNDYDR